MSLVCKFIEQIQRDNFPLSEQDKNLVLYALAKGFIDSNSKIICAVPVRDAAYFWHIDEGDIETFKHKSEDLMKKFSVEIIEKKRNSYFGLIETIQYDSKDIVIIFYLSHVEEWLQYDGAEVEMTEEDVRIMESKKESIYQNIMKEIEKEQ